MPEQKTQYKALFSEANIGTLKLKNRLIMAPMVRNYADARGLVTQKYVSHIKRIARGGVGAIILEASYISQDGKGFTNQLGIHTDDTIEGLRELVNAAHAFGVKIGPQLFHAGRQTSSAITGTQPLAPSAIPDPTVNEVPKQLDKNEIETIVENYGKAALRAKRAGCDFVEIHGAHGYLITQFLSQFSNEREDEYGGSLENRMRFLTEVVKSVRNAVGGDFPIIVRISADEMVPKGITPDDSKIIAKKLEELGVNAVHVSVGNYASFGRGYMIAPMAIEEAPIAQYAWQIKEVVSVPVIAVGKIRKPGLANDILEKGHADFIALGRPLLADPDWLNKARDGLEDEINLCIACNQGCITRLFEQKDVWCTVNPEISREDIFERPYVERKKKVVIVGGGPAGMEAAIVASRQGHDVVLFEQQMHLGGQLEVASAPPFRPGWKELENHLIYEVNRLGVDIRLNKKATVDIVQQEKPDMVVIAIGSSPIKPDIPGIGMENVVINRDILEERVSAKGDVIVAGGGCSGAQTAEFLADKGFKVTIVEMLETIAKDAAVADRDLLLRRLEEKGVKMLTETKIMKIETGKVYVERLGKEEIIPADTVVICLGAQPNDSLVKELKQVIDEVYVVGDALSPRKVTEAMAEAALAVLKVGEIGKELAA